MTRSVLVRDVRKAFGGQSVLDGVDFSLEAGAITALLGPSGCGKTTLLRAIAGFERIDDGAISIDGVEVSARHAHTPPEKRRVGYVPQEGALFPHLTVAGNVGFGLRRRDRTAERIGAALALVGLEALAGRYPHQLSGGQQQRVALARALAPGPRLVALDEPFNGLDLDLRRALCAEVAAALRRAGATAVLVTHDPEEAFASADAVAVMKSGRVVQQGSPEAVYRAPASADVARITGRAIFLDAALRDGVAETALGPAALRSVHPGCGSRAMVCVRPEQIVLGSADIGRPATVIERSFRGDHAMLTVMVGERRLSIRGPASIAVGASEAIHLGIAGPCVAFPADASA